MRKTSYAVAFILVAATLALNIIAVRRNDWIVARDETIPHYKVTVRYGLMERCERQVIEIPGSDGKLAYTDYQCRPFPASVTDHCEKENRAFCTEWTTAGYVGELGIWVGAMALLSLIFGVSTHSRRRRIWKAVAGLVALHALFPMITFAVVSDLYRTSRYPGFEHARFGTAYYLSMVSWVAAFAISFGVILTGVSAGRGHRWAAGNRAYTRIED
ncbi:hypothetical protein EW146_g1297 [Bondarzewia mesenterica]|uniref:Uncharacterized protein n=1 Tax=Bondarzewia mesenterica TaxID=1095465 RepID=A0A4V3XG44_9AGAM|nr:hypothetical protein EW146_g1297 [Bondarzewia mesenterica]